MFSLKTDRLELRRFKKRDYSDIFQYVKNPELCRMAYIPYIKTEKDAKRLVTDYIFDKHIAIVKDDQVIGSVSLYPSRNKYHVGYVLNPEFQGVGYMTEALICVFDYYFQKRKFDAVYADSYDKNEKSLNLISKLGFEFVSKKHDFDIDNNLVTVNMYCLNINKFYEVNGGIINGL